MAERSYTELFIHHGFKETIFEKFNKVFKCSDNWFGVSTYYPDARFERDNKIIILSLQGILMPIPYKLKFDDTTGKFIADLPEEILMLLKKTACRYIGFHENDKPIYENWGGVFPSYKFINDFIK